MNKSELVELVKEKFKNGERRDAIRDSLTSQGWGEGEIDEAISQIQHDAMRQMPGISNIIKAFENLEKKINHTSAKFITIVLVTCFIVVSVISIALYNWLDPLGAQSIERDDRREVDFIKLNSAVDEYFVKYGEYPQSLEKLIPNYLQSLPHDPKTGEFYKYKPLNGSSDYQLCVEFESKIGQCVSADPTLNYIPSSYPEQIVNPDTSVAPEEQSSQSASSNKL